MSKTRPIRQPEFLNDQEYESRLTDLAFWQPYVMAVLDHHNLNDGYRTPTVGIGTAWPTFVCGDLVVKLFGQLRSWLVGFRTEKAAHILLVGDTRISTPTLVAEGRLFLGNEDSWPYLVTTRIRGVDWREANPDADERRIVAAELGRQIRHVHMLRAWGEVASHTDWPVRGVSAAAARSSLPPHLAEQADGFVARLGRFDSIESRIRGSENDTVFVHGNLIPRNLRLDNGRLKGIVDWGDSLVTDRHYELARLFLDTLHCDKNLLRTFLNASNWPVGRDFARRAMGMALCRQAVGLSQHLLSDVFFKLPYLFPLEEIRTLDELAVEVFKI